MECFGTTDFDNNSRLITLSAIIISDLHCTCVYFVGTVIVCSQSGHGLWVIQNCCQIARLSSGFSTEFCIFSPIHATCLTRFIILGSITRMAFPTRHTSWSPCLLCSWHTAVTSSELPSACICCYKPIPTFRTLLNWSFHHLLLCLPTILFFFFFLEIM